MEAKISPDFSPTHGLSGNKRIGNILRIAETAYTLLITGFSGSARTPKFQENLYFVSRRFRDGSENNFVVGSAEIVEAMLLLKCLVSKAIVSSQRHKPRTAARHACGIAVAAFFSI
jgi:hypothetical protein